MTRGRLARAACVALLLFFLAPGTSSAAVARQDLDLATVTNAHYRAHRLLGNCVTSTNLSGENRQNVESYIQILEAVELTRPIAAQYRSSIVKIELGIRYFQQAKQATGKKRSELVALFNDAMRAAATLLDGAVKIFNEIQPQLVRLFAKGRDRHEGNGKESPFPIEASAETFHDCLPHQPDLRCCEDNYQKALLLFDNIKRYLTLEQREAILRCLEDTKARCLRLYNRNQIKFNKEYWENCFKGFVIFNR